MAEVRVVKSNWIGGELFSVRLFERQESGEFRWVYYKVGPLLCECDACQLRMTGQHDSQMIRNRHWFGLDSGLQS